MLYQSNLMKKDAYVGIGLIVFGVLIGGIGVATAGIGIGIPVIPIGIYLIWRGINRENNKYFQKDTLEFERSPKGKLGIGIILILIGIGTSAWLIGIPIMIWGAWFIYRAYRLRYKSTNELMKPIIAERMKAMEEVDYPDYDPTWSSELRYKKDDDN